MLKKLDRYILKKFLVTFVFIALLFVVIAMVIDFTDKVDHMISNKAPIGEILLKYYPTFIPWITGILGPFFVFIAVILFTSKLTYNSEIISILANSISFNRLLRPYFIGAAILVAAFLVGNHFLIPKANSIRNEFEGSYIWKRRNRQQHIEMVFDKQDKQEINVSLRQIYLDRDEGANLVYRKIEDGAITYQLRANKIYWDSTKASWRVPKYTEWQVINKQTESFIESNKTKYLDLGFIPKDFGNRVQIKEAMTSIELLDFIEKKKAQGARSIAFLEVEFHNRTAGAFAIFILTIIGASVSMRKVRGGMGLQLAIGLALSAIFVMFLKFSTTFAIKSNLPAFIAVWIPNIFFGLLALILIRRTPK